MCTIKIENCDTPKIAVILKFKQRNALKDTNGMANSADPDQTDVGLPCMLKCIIP